MAAIPSGKDKLALHFAAGEGHLEMVRNLLRIYPYGAMQPSKKGKLPLHFAARWGHLRVAQELLLAAPISIAEVDWEGSLPIHEAAREGEYRMCKFLLDRYPQGLHRANMRGEIPLFPAVRTNNLELVIMFLRVWPRGGKHILQIVREGDNVSSWNPIILELCLRGAVGNFTGCQLMDGKPQPTRCREEKEVFSGFLVPAALNRSRSLDTESSRRISAIEINENTASRQVSASSVRSTEGNLSNQFVSPILEISLPRSKSPILGQTDSDRKKRSSLSQNASERKRWRSGRDRGDELTSRNTKERPFIHLHAALECGASPVVIRCILKQFPHQLTQPDDVGQFPLHKAVVYCRRDEEVSLTVDAILKPFPSISQKRDLQERLPLHIALKARADFRVIKPLLEANASASVDLCKVSDRRFRKVPPIIMAAEHDCDLSTVYTLLRADPSILEVNAAEEVNSS